MNTLLMITFSIMALMLAAVGIYGMMAYSVTQRTHEIGLRMAVGPAYADIVRLVMGQALVLTTLGLALGLAGALTLSRLAASLLFRVSTTDSLTFFVVTALLGGVALLAGFIPARRATRVDPTTALRSE